MGWQQVLLDAMAPSPAWGRAMAPAPQMGSAVDTLVTKPVMGAADMTREFMDQGLGAGTDEEGNVTERAAGQSFNAAGLATLGGAPLAPRDPAAFTAGIKAFHGSGAAFDKFANDKIGTGEGAQAYGYGHYAAGNQKVADTYRPTEWQEEYSLNGKPLTDLYMRAADKGDYGAAAVYERIMLHEPRSKIEAYFREDPTSSQARRALEVLKGLPDDVFAKTGGHGYEVEINADPSHLLDWDKPYSEQSPHVQEGIARARGLTPADMPQDRSGSAHYYDVGLAAREPGPIDAAASRRLQEAGVPGIRYLDGMSRDIGEGTSNYVVFDPELITILKRYGLVGATLPPALEQFLHHSQGAQAPQPEAPDDHS